MCYWKETIIMTDINRLNNMTINELMAYINDNNITLEISNGRITRVIR